MKELVKIKEKQLKDKAAVKLHSFKYVYTDLLTNSWWNSSTSLSMLIIIWVTQNNFQFCFFTFIFAVVGLTTMHRLLQRDLTEWHLLKVTILQQRYFYWYINLVDAFGLVLFTVQCHIPCTLDKIFGAVAFSAWACLLSSYLLFVIIRQVPEFYNFVFCCPGNLKSSVKGLVSDLVV